MASQTNSADNERAPVAFASAQIFVFGSLDIKSSDEERTQFEDRCRALGKVLAQRGFLISVASAATFTVDLHVLAGANDWSEGRTPLKVQFIGPAKLPPNEPPLKNNPGDFPHLECKVRLLRGDWEPSHQKQLDEADGVILIGGNPHGVSDFVGRAAMQRGLPFIPVPIFDGAGEVLWDEHKATLQTQRIPVENIATMSEEFSAELVVASLITLMENRTQNSKPEPAPSQPSKEPIPKQPTEPEEPGKNSGERLDLVKRLSAIPSPQFSQLLFAIDPPPGIVPDGGAQADKVAALMKWAEGPGGCGLAEIEQLLESL